MTNEINDALRATLEAAGVDVDGLPEDIVPTVDSTIVGTKGADTLLIGGVGVTVFGGSGTDEITVFGENNTVFLGTPKFPENGGDSEVAVSELLLAGETVVTPAGGDGGISNGGDGIQLTSLGQLGDGGVFRIRNATDEDRTFSLEENGGGEIIPGLSVPANSDLIVAVENGGPPGTYLLFEDGVQLDSRAQSQAEFGDFTVKVAAEPHPGLAEIVDLSGVDGNTDIGGISVADFTALLGQDFFVNGGTVFARGGDTTIFGGGATDFLEGGVGDDTLYGGASTDDLDGGDGDDELFGEDGNDFIDGGAGNDVAFGGAGGDLILGGLGDDEITGDFTAFGTVGGDDYINGGAGADTINGGAGNDTLIGGEAGSVTFMFGDTLSVVGDRISGGFGNDEIIGSEGLDLLDGGVGHDTIYGGAGIDGIEGGTGRDHLFGEGGDDILDGEGGRDVIDGGEGNDQLDGGRGNDQLDGGQGNDRLNGERGHDRLDGGDGDDTLNGGDGDDILFGGTDAGNDALIGGDGNDVFVFSTGSVGLDVLSDFTAGEDKILIVDTDGNPVAYEDLIIEVDTFVTNISVDLGSDNPSQGLVTIFGAPVLTESDFVTPDMPAASDGDYFGF